MATIFSKIIEGNGYLYFSFIVCLCSMGLMCLSWFMYGELITTFYHTHISENFGEDDKTD